MRFEQHRVYFLWILFSVFSFFTIQVKGNMMLGNPKLIIISKSKVCPSPIVFVNVVTGDSIRAVFSKQKGGFQASIHPEQLPAICYLNENESTPRPEKLLLLFGDTLELVNPLPKSKPSTTIQWKPHRNTQQLHFLENYLTPLVNYFAESDSNSQKEEAIQSIIMSIDSLQKLSNSQLNPFFNAMCLKWALPLLAESRQLQLLVKSFEFRSNYQFKYITDVISLCETYLHNQIGNPAMDFILSTRENKEIRLSDFKGKVVLIDFWASWCKPCREANPWLREAYLLWEQLGFSIIGISLDTDNNAWNAAIVADNIPWIQVLAKEGVHNNVIEKYLVKSLPQNLLIDQNGIIIAKNLTPIKLFSKLRELKLINSL